MTFHFFTSYRTITQIFMSKKLRIRNLKLRSEKYTEMKLNIIHETGVINFGCAKHRKEKNECAIKSCCN